MKSSDPFLRKLEVQVSDLAHHFTFSQEAKKRSKWEISWKERYQRIWKEDLGLFTLTLLVFVSSLIVGINIGLYKEDYALLFIPQNMMENVLDQHSWFERLQKIPLIGALGIAFNNIRVAFLAYTGGALLGWGGILLLSFNGLMIGGMYGYCQANGFHDKLLNFVSTHGFVELTMIIAAAFASLLIGRVFYMRPFSQAKKVYQ